MTFKKKDSVNYEDLGLTFWAMVPIPKEQKALIEKFKGQAAPIKGKPNKTFYMSHGRPKTEEFAEAIAIKPAPANRWRTKILKGNSIIDQFKQFSFRGKAVQIAAEKLADTITDIKQRFERARTFNIGKKQILDYEFGDNQNVRGRSSDAFPDTVDGDKMQVEACIPMPEGFYHIFDQMRESVPAEDRGDVENFKIGYDDREDKDNPGVVLVSKDGLKKWRAFGLGDLHYSQKFKGLSQEEVIDKIAFDLAAGSYPEDKILSHICSHVLKQDEIAEIKTASDTFDQDDLQAGLKGQEPG